MATELAKAYVQIMPSARGIADNIKNTISGEGNSAGDTFGKSLIGKVKTLIAAAGIGKLIGESINEGAALQQSIGGVETLFKESADTVKQYADAAYSTAGLSANEYMETVTGFSASLLQGLGGDTAAAAETANMAIIDMADNANKFGTDMSSIQNAYQGFAKQNYTMLDNLKLGYGGTKSEMERLLVDAQKISGVKYDLNNLSDVYEAIHVIQEEMDVTGTTALEASSTFSGSMAAMKAAAKNLLGNLTLGEDIYPSLEALSDTAWTFVHENLIPMFGNLLQAIPETIPMIGSWIVRSLVAVSNNSGEIISMGQQLISKLVTGIVAEIPYFIEVAWDLIESFATTLIDADWNTIAAEFIDELKTGLDIAAGEILGTDEFIVSDILDGITAAFPRILEKGVEIVSNLANGVLENIPEILTAAGEMIDQLLGCFLEILPDFWNSGADLLLNIVQGIADNLPQIVNVALNIVTNLLLTITGKLPEIMQEGVKILLELVNGILDSLPNLISSAIEVVFNFLNTIGENLPDILKQGGEMIAELIKGIGGAIPDVVEKIGEVVIQAKDAFLEYDWIQLGKDIIGGIAEGILGAAGSVLNAIGEVASGALEKGKEFFDINSPSKVMRDQIGQWIPKGIAVGIKENVNAVEDAMNELTLHTSGKIQRTLLTDVSGMAAFQSGKDMTYSNGYTQNIYISSPKELNPSEVARQTRNANRQMILAMRGVV